MQKKHDQGRGCHFSSWGKIPCRQKLANWQVVGKNGLVVNNGQVVVNNGQVVVNNGLVVNTNSASL